MPAPLRVGFGLPFSQAVAAARRRGATVPDEYYDLPPEMRRFAFTISGLAGLEQIRQVQESLERAVRDGQTFAQWKADLDPSVATLGRARLDLVYRMNAQTAYMAGHYRNMKAAAALRPFWMYSAINDARTRPTHRAMSGHIAHHDDPVWKAWFPPAGFNCRCTVISLTEAQARARGWDGKARPPQPPDPGFAGVPTDGGKAAEALLRKRVAEGGPAFARAYQDALKRQVAPTWMTKEQEAASNVLRQALVASDPAFVKLTSSEVAAIHGYAGADSFGNAIRMNGILRGVKKFKPTDQDIGAIQALASAVRKLEGPATAPARILYRGIRLRETQIPAFLKDAKPGAIMEAGAFTSTTETLAIAQDFAGAAGVVFRLVTRRGANLAPMARPLGIFPETLVAPGTKFRIVKVRETMSAHRGRMIEVDLEDVAAGVPTMGL